MTFPGSPRLLKGGIVIYSPDGIGLPQVINLQYNPDTLTRSLQIQGVGSEGGTHTEPLRLKGPAVETIKLDAEIDLTDQLEVPDQYPDAVQYGIFPQLAALEILVYPSSGRLRENDFLAQIGCLEILPAMAPLTVFVWNKHRTVPVKLTDFSITEEAFDPNLNPIRAKVSLGMKVLTINDLDFHSRGGRLFMTYLQQKESWAHTSPFRVPGSVLNIASLVSS
jgi:hypothetical protein